MSKGVLGGSLPASSISDSDLKRAMRLHPAIWAQFSGLKVDGLDFSFDKHRYMFPIYCDRSVDMRIMKGAQMGNTIWMALRAFHQTLYPKSWGYKIPIKVGFYFPDRPGLNIMVKSRLEPLMMSCPDLLPWSKEKSHSWKPIGESALYFMYIKGKSSKDSMPFMSIFYDEIRLVDIRDVEQTYERVSNSPIPYKVHASTAGYPETDIHALFLNSDQKWWTTVCERCGCEQVLPLEFPECIAEPKVGPRAGQAYYICRKCREEIPDTQNGLYVPHGDKDHYNSGYQYSQLISKSPTCHPRLIMESFRKAKNKKEWFNGKLGIPYVDMANRPVTEDILVRNVNPLLEWGDDGGGTTFMGVDQMLNLNYVFVVSRTSGGEKRRVVWFEIVAGEDPWRRTGQILEDFGVRCCVVDSEPNGNEALRFAHDFERRVFLAKRGDYDDLVRWGDGWRTKQQFRRAEKDSFYQYRVFLDKYLDIERTLEWIVGAKVEWPDPRRRTQVAVPIGGGRAEEMPIMETHAYRHFASPVREQKVIDESTGKYKWQWRFLGGDPHALDALCYALRASERRIVVSGVPFSY